MPIKIENDCVDCGKPCLGIACPYFRVKHFYCDECGEDCDPGDMHEVDGKIICSDCLIPYLEKTGVIGPVPKE